MLRDEEEKTIQARTCCCPVQSKGPPMDAMAVRVLPPARRHGVPAYQVIQRTVVSAQALTMLSRDTGRRGNCVELVDEMYMGGKRRYTRPTVHKAQQHHQDWHAILRKPQRMTF